jgi:hypothetical protein
MKPELTRGARNLLRRAVEAIQRHPHTLNMALWMTHDSSVEGDEPYCGTVACLAGHIVLVSGLKPARGGEDHYEIDEIPSRLYRPGDQRVAVRSLALRLLGDDVDPSPLFATDDWPIRFERNYKRFKTARARARVLRDRVKHWLETGE